MTQQEAIVIAKKYADDHRMQYDVGVHAAFVGKDNPFSVGEKDLWYVFFPVISYPGEEGIEPDFFTIEVDPATGTVELRLSL